MKRVIVPSLLLIASIAAAAPVVKSSHEDLATIAALTRVHGQMALCWQGKPPAAVTIKLSVAKSGQVTKATAKTKGAAAQCAAGILAVSTLAPQAKAWKGTVTLQTDASGKAQDAVVVNDALVAAGDSLRACQSVTPSYAGNVKLTVTIGADGRLIDAGAEWESAGGFDVSECVETAARQVKFPALTNELTYQLEIAFAGAPSGGTSGGGGDLTGGQQPTRKGALEGSVVSEVVDKTRGSIRACGDKGTATGTLKIRVVIGADGKVGKVEIKSSELNDEKIEKCVVAVFRKMKFPAADGETTFVYPIKF
jgi:hypothetical protein